MNLNVFLNIRGIPKRFDCGHLVALYFRQALGFQTDDWVKVSRWYPKEKEIEYIFNTGIENGFLEVSDDYREGDVIIYRRGDRGACAVCVNDKSAIILEGVSKLIHIERINNKLHHLRHGSLEGQNNA